MSTLAVGYHHVRVRAIASFLAHLLILAMGCGLVVRAGRLEGRGHLVAARRGARSGGFLAAIGSLAAAAGVRVLPPSAGGARGLVAGLMLGAGFAALLAGLSGKPRPTGWAAVGLLGAGIVVALLVVR